MVRLDHGFCNGTGFIIKMFKLQAVYIYSIDHQCFLIMWDRCSYSYVFAFFTDVIIHSVRVVGEPLSPFPATRRYCQKHSKLLVYLDSETVRRSRDTATTDFFLSSWTCWMITLCTCFDCPIYRVVEMVESCNSSKLLDEGIIRLCLLQISKSISTIRFDQVVEPSACWITFLSILARLPSEVWASFQSESLKKLDDHESSVQTL